MKPMKILLALLGTLVLSFPALAQGASAIVKSSGWTDDGTTVTALPGRNVTIGTTLPIVIGSYGGVTSNKITTADTLSTLSNYSLAWDVDNGNGHTTDFHHFSAKGQAVSLAVLFENGATGFGIENPNTANAVTLASNYLFCWDATTTGYVGTGANACIKQTASTINFVLAGGGDAAITSGGASLRGTSYVYDPSIGTGRLNLGVNSIGNGSAYFNLAASNAATNWQISTNNHIGGALEIIPSTAGGGLTFTTPVVTITTAGAEFSVTVRAGGYKSSDGTAGATVSTCTAFKNGLCISGT